MRNVIISATSRVTDADLNEARLGPRFSRLDLSSRLALQAVESLDLTLDGMPRDRIGICMAARAGSLSTDFEYWKGRALTGGPSPTLFAYTLPSAAIGEIAIRHRLTGPNICMVGEYDIMAEATELIRRGEADACVCVECNVISPDLSALIQQPPVATATAHLLKVE